MIAIPCITPGRPRAHIRMMVLVHHTTEASPVGFFRIDLHLGQKPKLGGRYTDVSLIDISYSVGTLYIHISLSFVFAFVLFQLSKTQKAQKYFCCFSSFIYLAFKFQFVSFSSYGFLLKTKIQKDFALFAVSKIENPKIFVVLLWFCKACCSVHYLHDSIGAWLSFHIQDAQVNEQ